MKIILERHRMSEFYATLQSWQNFYFMMGGVAATLLGLMFVAISLGMPHVTDANRDDIKTFVNPSIFYFVSGILIAALMLIPDNNPGTLALILLLMALFGATQIIRFAIRLVQAALKHQDFDVPEWSFQIIFPLLSNLLMLLAAGFFYFNQWSFGFLALWFVIVLLLISAISNTWSLIMWIVEQRRE
jgi:hypothetical protein